ncbi:MAG: DUF4252 domain-containing protein [Bacteroidales bacterium]|nr:DUF4252 domain-containing protein [Bacteroidales bacterium]
MKKIIFAAILAAFSITAFAQSYDLENLYYNYKGEKGVVALRIPGFVMRLAGSSADMDSEERQLLRSMRSVQIVAIEDTELNSRVNFVEEVDLNNLNNGYNLLLRVQDGAEDVAILTREKQGRIRDLVVLTGGDENVMVRIRGRMNADLVDCLADVSGIGQLKHLEGI